MKGTLVKIADMWYVKFKEEDYTLEGIVLKERVLPILDVKSEEGSEVEFYTSWVRFGEGSSVLTAFEGVRPEYKPQPTNWKQIWAMWAQDPNKLNFFEYLSLNFQVPEIK